MKDQAERKMTHKGDDFSWPSKRELEVLKILQKEPTGMYGLAIVDRSNGAIDRNSVYKWLARLEDKGFVRVRKTTANHPGMPRPMYVLTAAGQRAIGAHELLAVGSVRSVP